MPSSFCICCSWLFEKLTTFSTAYRTLQSCTSVDIKPFKKTDVLYAMEKGGPDINAQLVKSPYVVVSEKVVMMMVTLILLDGILLLI